jgi:hypothetical protein
MSDVCAAGGRSFSTVGNEGPLVEDEFKVGLGEFSRVTNFSQVIVGVTSYDPATVSTSFDGWIGFGPFSAHPDIKDINFMYSLKQQGVISHNVVSFLMPRGETGTIGMGIYDPKNHEGDLQLIKTKDVSAWALRSALMLYDNVDITYSEERLLKIDPQLPYIYLPAADWDRLTGLMAAENDELVCSGSQCGFSKSCSDTELEQLANFTIQLEVFDDEKTIELAFESINKSMMIDSGSSCVLPIFKNQNGDEESWYLGSIFLHDYYMVLDVTPYDEGGQDYIQVGIARRNDSYSQTSAQYDYSYPDYQWDFKVKFNDSSARIENYDVVEKLPSPAAPEYPELNGTYTGPISPFLPPADAIRYHAGSVASVYRSIDGKPFWSWDMAWFMVTHQAALLWQMAVWLYPFTSSYMPPIFVPAPAALLLIYENQPDAFTNPEGAFMEAVADLLPKFGYALEFTGDFLLLNWAAIKPYDGEIKQDYFWWLQLYCIALWWMNNYLLINFIPAVAVLWSADWSFTEIYNGVIWNPEAQAHTKPATDDHD